jgi:hypothetical protein
MIGAGALAEHVPCPRFLLKLFSGFSRAAAVGATERIIAKKIKTEFNLKLAIWLRIGWCSFRSAREQSYSSQAEGA